MDLIKEKMGAGYLYGVWLTSKEGVCEFYNSGPSTEITEYRIPDDALVISDLDEDGALFVTRIHPDELATSYEVYSEQSDNLEEGAA